MRTLTTTLAAAQQKYDVLPVVKVMVSDNPPEVPRLSELASLYIGSEPDAVFDATWTSDGYICRCYIDSSGNVWAQVNPGNATGNSWSTWATIATGAYATGGGAICCYGWQDNSKRVTVYWVDSTGHVIKSLTWNNFVWGVVQTVYDVGAGNLIASIACDCQDPTLRLIFAVSGGALWEMHYTNNVWSAPVSDGGTWTLPTIAYAYRPVSAPKGDGNGFVMVCWGSPQQAVSVKVFEPNGGGWLGGYQTIQQYGTGTGYTATYPKGQEARGDCKRAVFSWVETGPSPYGAQPIIEFTASHAYPTEFVPWRYPQNCTHGVKVFKSSATAFGGPYWWVVSTSQVYQVVADTGSSVQRASFAQNQVEGIRIDQSAVNHPAEISVSLLNENGALSNAGVVGTSGQPLRRWSQVVISLGYHTTAGDETVWQMPCWIDQVVFHDDPTSGMPLVTLHCIDCWGLLEQLRFRWTATVTGGSAGSVLTPLVYHVAGDLTWSSDTALNSVALSSFTFNAGETLGQAVRRLLEYGACILNFRTFATSADGSGWDSVQILTVEWAKGGSVASYQQETTSEASLLANVTPILSSELAPYVVPTATSVEVVGSTTTSVWRNWPAIWDLWHDLASKLVDKTLANQSLTDDVVANLGTLFVPERWGGQFTSLGNVGLELGDQVTLTVPTAPISGQVYTVAGLTTSWDRTRGTILQTVLVEGTN